MTRPLPEAAPAHNVGGEDLKELFTERTILLWLCLSCPGLAPAAETPYFRLPGGGAVESLPLEFSAARVDISHAVAAVKLTQRFGNRGDVPIEAIYVFPGSPTAAVRGLSLQVGERRIEAQIRERSQAEQVYAVAKEAGQTASLLRQTGVGTYEVNVANILPGDAIEVELRYVEQLVPSNGSYRFELPNTFGVDRYDEALEGERRETSADRAVVQDAWFVSARVQAAVPIARLDSPSHAVEITRAAAADWRIVLDPAERQAASKDFVLEYSLSGGAVQTGLMLYEHEGQGWFLWTMEPPFDVEPDQIPPREFIFVLDVSGSMSGPPLDTAKQLMRSLARVLRPTDHLNAIAFAGGSNLLARRSLPATQATVDRLLAFVDQRHSGGGTELLPALQRAYELPDVGAMRTVVIVTDGGIGRADEAAGRIMDELSRSGTFVFGVGQYLDPQTLHRLADAAQTRLLQVQDNRLDPVALEAFRGYVDRPLLRDVQLQFEGMTVSDLQPAGVPVLYAARPLTVAGRYRPPARGQLTIRGDTAFGPFERQVEVGAFRPSAEAEAVRHLWAQRAVSAALSTANRDAARETVTQLGLSHGLMTPWTYFVAVDQQVRNLTGDSERAQQPNARRAVPLSLASGDLTALAATLRLGAEVRDRGSRPAQCRVIEGIAFVQGDGRWSATLGAANGRVRHELRVRPGGAAWRSLQQQLPELQAWTDLGSLELRVGHWRLVVAADGFDHYPAETLKQLAGLLRSATAQAAAGRCASVGRS